MRRIGLMCRQRSLELAAELWMSLPQPCPEYGIAGHGEGQEVGGLRVLLRAKNEV